MACGLPVIASPVGVNCRIVEHGVNGYIAGTDQEWLRAFRELMNNPVRRRSMGAAGRLKVESDYSLKVMAPRLETLLREVVTEVARRRGSKGRE
jgi:hypothetical protein